MSLDTLELVDLEELILEDDHTCEFDHKTRPDSICSTKVTHRITATCQGITVLICANAAKEKRDQMEKGDTTCRRCGRLARDCWKMFPV